MSDEIVIPANLYDSNGLSIPVIDQGGLVFKRGQVDLKTGLRIYHCDNCGCKCTEFTDIMQEGTDGEFVETVKTMVAEGWEVHRKKRNKKKRSRWTFRRKA